MENQIDLREIAELNGLTYAESTSGSNGYPSNIKGIIIGFDNFEDAKKLAEEHNLSIEFFTKKDGWPLWCRTGNNAHEAMKNSSDDYGDNYSQFDKMTEEEFQALKDRVKRLEQYTVRYDKHKGEQPCLWDSMPETTPGSGVKIAGLSCPCPKCTPRY